MAQTVAQFVPLFLMLSSCVCSPVIYPPDDLSLLTFTVIRGRSSVRQEEELMISSRQLLPHVHSLHHMHTHNLFLMPTDCDHDSPSPPHDGTCMVLRLHD